MSSSRPFKLRFSQYDRIIINDVEYSYIETLSDGYNFQSKGGDLVEFFSRDQLAKLRNEKKFGVDRDFYALGKARARGESGLELLSNLPADEQHLITRREDWCRAFLALEKTDPAISRSDVGMETAIIKIQATMLATSGIIAPADGTLPKGEKKQRTDKVQTVHVAPSSKTLRTWLKRYENSGYDARALRPRFHHCGNTRPRLPGDIRHILNKHVSAYMDEKRPPKIKCYNNFIREIQSINDQRHLSGLSPIQAASQRTFFLAIGQLSKFAVYAKRHGLEAAKRKFHMSSGGLDVLRPLERVETDEWHIHLHTVLADLDLLQFLSSKEIERLERYRWHLCVAIDCVTRCILGASVAATASPQNALRVLHLVCIDKTDIACAAGAVSPWDMYGTPDSISADNGSSFISTEFRVAVSDLGANPDFPPAGFPELRGRIERTFRTIDSKVMSDFVGRSFSNIVELGDYPAERRAAITIEELFDVLVRYIVDQYHIEPHDGLLGETPRNAWIRLTDTYGAPPPPTANTLRSIFGIKLKRTIGDYGIRFLGQWYQSEQLQVWRRQYGDIKIDISVDQEDLGEISAKLGKSWVQLSALADWAAGLSVRTWIGVCTDLRARFSREAEIARHTVTAAIRDRQELNARAIKRAALEPAASAEEIDRTERDMALSFRWQSQAVADPAGDCDLLYDNTIPVAPIALPPAPASSELPPEKDDSDDNNWRIED